MICHFLRPELDSIMMHAMLSCCHHSCPCLISHAPQFERQTVIFQKREQDLMHQLMLPVSQRTTALLNQMKADHESLLHSHLMALQQFVLNPEHQANLEASEITVEQIKHEKIDLNNHPLFVVQSIETMDKEQEQPVDPEGASQEVTDHPEVGSDLEDPENCDDKGVTCVVPKGDSHISDLMENSSENVKRKLDYGGHDSKRLKVQ